MNNVDEVRGDEFCIRIELLNWHMTRTNVTNCLSGYHELRHD